MAEVEETDASNRAIGTITELGLNILRPIRSAIVSPHPVNPPTPAEYQRRRESSER